MKKVIVGVCGFSWSGSGAVLDYLMEFGENQVYTPEFIIAYHPDGLHDLDINLNENCAKFLSSGVAIPRFKKLVDSLLNVPTNGNYRNLTEKYIDDITQAKWIGLEQGQELLRNRWIYRNIGLRIRNKVITKLSPEFCWQYKPYPLGEMYFSICPDEFLRKTQKYIDELLSSIGLNLEKNIILNQPFPGNNPRPYMKYFKNSKAIVVDRDPRDVFVFLKYVFPGHSYSVPLQNVNEFCTYFDSLHKNLKQKLDNPDILYIQFEDLIYHYERTAAQICEFLNLGNNDNPRNFFIPEESEANTQVFQRFGKREELNVIEERLSPYLYDFSKVMRKNVKDKCFDDNPKSKMYSFMKE